MSLKKKSKLFIISSHSPNINTWLEFVKNYKPINVSSIGFKILANFAW